MKVVMVNSKSEMEQALRDAGLTPSPIPQSNQVVIEEAGITIMRDVSERDFECGHPVSTDRFVGETDWCEVCGQMRKVVK